MMKKQDTEFDQWQKTGRPANTGKEKFKTEIKRKMEESWNKIFDMNYDMKYVALPFNQKAIQATFWTLKKEEIINVDHFTSR